MKPNLLCAIGVAAVSLPTILSAQVTLQENAIVSGGYTISTVDDLLLHTQPSASDYSTEANSGNTFALGFTGGNSPDNAVNNAAALANLTDGSYGGNVPSEGGFASGGPSGLAGIDVTYSLGSNLLGYNITDIELYSGWQDSGRYQQAYTIEYSTVDDPTYFFTLRNR